VGRAAARPEITVSFEDVVEGRAYLRIPFWGKLLLAHWAGAPWNDTDTRYGLHSMQVEVIARNEREKIVRGASRLGKSVLGGVDLVEEAMLPGSSFAVVAARYDHVAHEWQYLYRGLKRLFQGRTQAFKSLKNIHRQNYYNFVCETIWGSKGRGVSTDADDGAQLLGWEATRLVLGEGSHVSKDILEKKALRALDGALKRSKDGFSRETGRLSIYTTPKEHEGCSASEEDRILKQTSHEPEKLWYGRVPFAETAWIREASILENPAYPREVFEARRRSLSTAAFEEQYMGKRGFSSGMVLREFRADHHVRPAPPADIIRGMRLGLGIDTGVHFAAGLAGVARDGTMWGLGEVYTERQTIGDNLEETKEMVTEVLGPVFGLKSFEALKDRVEFWVPDPASQHKLEIEDILDVDLVMPTNSQVTTSAKGRLELIPSLDLMRTWLQASKLFFADDLIITQDQIQKYVWKQMKTTGGFKGSKPPVIREPRKEYDHLIDAFRFVLLMLAEAGPLEVEPAPLTIADAWRQAQRERIFGPLRVAKEQGAQDGGTWC